GHRRWTAGGWENLPNRPVTLALVPAATMVARWPRLPVRSTTAILPNRLLISPTCHHRRPTLRWQRTRRIGGVAPHSIGTVMRFPASQDALLSRRRGAKTPGRAAVEGPTRRLPCQTIARLAVRRAA